MKRNYRRLLYLVVPLALGGIVFWQRWAIFDTWRLRDYSAPDAVVALADATAMKDSARRLFYVYHPAILDKADFNTYCRDNEHTIVLGCYRTARGIYIYDVADPRLNGIKEVTAAHELFHGA